ncbi:MAG: hypothetical protein FP816_18700 [Desulfobacteraceae bacterium]|nr:hypothetical protein [Desulfobacteraceae bacterium]MBU4052872.1 hypothetical protein [Pseudomonadota bacterium]
MEQNKKMAAALAAVAAYIKSEQEARMMAGAQFPGEIPATGSVTVIEKIMGHQNPWGTSGRQAQMQMRSLMQMKSFHGAKIR